VDRTGGEASERALRTGLRVLAAGELLGIYPEGTRTPDGRLYRGKTGVARLALEARAPVIPTAMIGGFEFQPPGKLTPRLRIRPGVRFGKALDFSRYYGLEQDAIVLRAMTDEIMYELMKLSGQEYVDEYAQRAKGRLTSHLRHSSPAPKDLAPGPADGSTSPADGPAAPGDGGPVLDNRRPMGDKGTREPENGVRAPENGTPVAEKGSPASDSRDLPS
jgi:hypothetical protein